MTAIVPRSVVDRTDRCRHDHACLATGDCGAHPLCTVSYPDGRDMLFLSDRAPAVCPYRIGFGDAQVCTCPVHYALHMSIRP